MSLPNGMRSLVLFVLSIIVLVLLTLFESVLVGLSVSTERIISFVLLVLPPLAGLGFGVLGLIKKEPRKWISIIGILLNGSFAAFMTFVLSFAG